MEKAYFYHTYIHTQNKQTNKKPTGIIGHMDFLFADSDSENLEDEQQQKTKCFFNKKASQRMVQVQ